MKVLWFTNNAVNLHPGTLSGGWMQSLEQYLTMDDSIQLYIATRAKCINNSILKVNRSTYIPITDKRTLVKKRLAIFLNREPHAYFLDQYLSIIEQVKPDIIQVFGSEMDYGLICGKVNIPVILHIQGILNPYFYQLVKNKVSFFQQLKCHSVADFIRGSTFQNGFKNFERRTFVERIILENCQNLIGRSAWDQRVMSILAPNARYFHCDEILRNDFFKSSWKSTKNETINIVSTISGAAYKGHDNIIATCQVLSNAGISFKWHIVGINMDAIAYHLHYQAHRKLVKDKIRFHGNLAPSAMIQVLMESDVYVHPSHIENSSNALCEAMALGMPVIALDVGGNVSMVADGVDGMIVPDNDPFSLAGMIKKVVHDTVLSAELGRRAKLRAAVRHDPATIIKHLKAIYSELVDQHAI